MSEGYQPRPGDPNATPPKTPSGTPGPKIARPEILSPVSDPPTGLIRPNTADETVIDGHVVNLRTGIRAPKPLLADVAPDQPAAPVGGVTVAPVLTASDKYAAAPGAPLLPPGVEPLGTASLRRHANSAVAIVREGIVKGEVSDDEIEYILRAIPRTRMRKLVYEYAGMGASLLMTLNKQSALVDAVLSQLVDPEGHLVPQNDDYTGMSLKDAMNMSLRNSQLIMRELPKVYDVARIQRLEMAIGEVMEKYMTPKQQAKVMERLEELTTDKAR